VKLRDRDSAGMTEEAKEEAKEARLVQLTTIDLV